MTQQLELGFLELEARLRALGLPADVPVALHANARVLVTRTARGVLRLHRGYGHAPDDVLRAIVEWARPRVRRTARLAAERTLVGFPVHAHVPPGPERRRPDVVRPGDTRLVQRLQELHADLNARHFAGMLGSVKIGLSYQMRRKLGEFRPPTGPAGRASIVLGRRHIRRDGWSAAVETFLHEMIHQWQSETGQPLAHDRAFRKKAAAVGIDGRAVRMREYLCGEGASELGSQGARTMAQRSADESTIPAGTETALKLWVVLSRAYASIYAHAAAHASEHGLSLTEFAILEALYHRGRMVLGDIQRRILVSSGGITFLVDRLADKGLVVRQECLEDRRAKWVALTKEGGRLIRDIFPSHARALANAAGGLTSEEQAEATRLLKTLGLAATDGDLPQNVGTQRRLPTEAGSRRGGTRATD